MAYVQTLQGPVSNGALPRCVGADRAPLFGPPLTLICHANFSAPLPAERQRDLWTLLSGAADRSQPALLTRERLLNGRRSQSHGPGHSKRIPFILAGDRELRIAAPAIKLRLQARRARIGRNSDHQAREYECERLQLATAGRCWRVHTEAP